MTDSSTSTAYEPACPDCGYSLHGIASNRCPECGIVIDWSELNVSPIPWLFRGSTGRFHAYWRTVWLVMFRPSRVAREMSRSARPSDARSFRRVTICLAYFPLLFMAGGFFALSSGRLLPGTRIHRAHLLGWILYWILFPIVLFSAVAWLSWATRAASLFFRPSSMVTELKRRAVVISDYACAPLAFAGVSALFIFSLAVLPVVLMRHRVSEALIFAAELAAIVGSVLPMLSWWTSTLFLFRRTTHASYVSVMLLAIYLPAAWIVLALVAALVPLCYLFLSEMLLSLR